MHVMSCEGAAACAIARQNASPRWPEAHVLIARRSRARSEIKLTVGRGSHDVNERGDGGDGGDRIPPPPRLLQRTCTAPSPRSRQ